MYKALSRTVAQGINKMGKHWRRKNRGGNKGQLGVRRRGRSDYTEIVKENEQWEKYYKSQNMLGSDDEFLKMKKTFQDPLPLTFRITGSSSHVKDVSKFFAQKIVPQMEKAENSDESKEHKPPFPLKWYPGQLAFQIDLPKRVIKKDPVYAAVQEFLVAENEVGNISRQEAVSMVPPLFLDVKPEHYVLDMCAAPGSKTAQLIEALHTTENDELPKGFVMANDSDYKRSYMLVHQIKRLNSPNYLVVNHDAQMFPKIRLEENGPYIKFDRILCDVPCSGDGTFRKNIMIWREWCIGNGLGLHRLQLNILLRGIQLLKEGGRLVYSTCSLNPIEDEAVVTAALKKMGGQVRTVDCSSELPNLIRKGGLTHWKVYNKKFELQDPDNFESSEVPATAFPPKEDEIKDLHLENCVRVYPHYQNTGGFFITVFEKPVKEKNTELRKHPRDGEEEADNTLASKKQKTEIADDSSDESATVVPVIAPTPAKKTKLPFDANEEPFSYVDEDNKDLQKCWDFYEIGKSFPRDCSMVRNATGEPMRSIYFTSPVIKQIIQHNEEKLKLIYSGVKMFVYQKNYVCPWRIQNDSVDILKNYLPNTREISGNMSVFKILLEQDYPSVDVIKDENADPQFVTEIEKAPEGSCFLNIRKDGGQEKLLLPMWKGKVRVNLMVDKHEKAELLYRFFGINKNEQDKKKKQADEEQANKKIREAEEKKENNDDKTIDA